MAPRLGGLKSHERVAKGVAPMPHDLLHHDSQGEYREQPALCGVRGQAPGESIYELFPVLLLEMKGRRARISGRSAHPLAHRTRLRPSRGRCCCWTSRPKYPALHHQGQGAHLEAHPRRAAACRFVLGASAELRARHRRPRSGDRERRDIVCDDPPGLGPCGAKSRNICRSEPSFWLVKREAFDARDTH